MNMGNFIKDLKHRIHPSILFLKNTTLIIALNQDFANDWDKNVKLLSLLGFKEQSLEINIINCDRFVPGKGNQSYPNCKVLHIVLIDLDLS